MNTHEGRPRAAFSGSALRFGARRASEVMDMGEKLGRSWRSWVGICGFPNIGGTPSDHPNFHGIVHEINHPAIGVSPMTLESSISK